MARRPDQSGWSDQAVSDEVFREVFIPFARLRDPTYRSCNQAAAASDVLGERRYFCLREIPRQEEDHVHARPGVQIDVAGVQSQTAQLLCQRFNFINAHAWG